MLAGTLEIQMLANMARLSEDMAKAKGIVGDAVRGIEELLGSLGLTFSVAMLIEKFNSVVEAMDQIRIASEKTGASIEELSQLQFFAGATGTGIETVTMGLVRLSKAEAAAGNLAAPATQALRYLGLTAKDSAGNLKDPAVLYAQIGEEFEKMPDGANKAALAVALFGRAGAEQIAIMKLQVEMGTVEATTTTAQADAAKEYRVQVALLNQQETILWNTVVTAILPSLESFIKVLIGGQKEAGSLSSVIKGFASDHSIEDWADRAMMAVAHLVDVFTGFATVVNMIGKGLGGAMATVGRTEAWMLKMPAKGQSVIDFLKKAPGDLRAQIGTIDDAMLADIQAAGMKYGSTADALTAQIAARKKAAETAAVPPPPKDPRKPFDPTAGARGEKEATAYAAFVKAQQAALDKVTVDADASQRLLLDASLAHNLTGYTEYYAAREVLERKDSAIKIQTLQTSIAAENKALAGAQTPEAKYAAMAKLVTQQGELTIAKENEGRIGAKTAQDEADAWRKYYLERNTLQQQMLTSQGKAVEAYVIGIDKQWSDELKRMESNGDVAGAAIAHALINTGLIKAQLEDVTTRFGRVQTDLTNQEKTITLQSSRGIISEFAGRQQILALRQSFLPQMRAELTALEAVDKATATPDQLQRMVALRQALDDVATSASTVNRTMEYGAKNALGAYEDAATNAAENIKLVVTDAFKGMEDALVAFTTTGKLDFKALTNSMIADMARMSIRQNITGPLAKAMGGGGGDGSNILSTLMGWAGMGGGASTVATSGGAVSLAEAFSSGFAAMAGGGAVAAGSPYIVGEQGPEVFVPNASGEIIPNGRSPGSRLNVTNVFHISGATDTRSQSQIAAAAGQGVNRALARNT